MVCNDMDSVLSDETAWSSYEEVTTASIERTRRRAVEDLKAMLQILHATAVQAVTLLWAKDPIENHGKDEDQDGNTSRPAT